MRSETYSLGELVTIKYGKNQKKVLSDKGTIPIYGTGGFMGYATESLYDKPSVLIGRKGTIEKIRYVDSPFWTVDTLFYTIVNEKIVIPQFLYYAMLQIDLIQYNEGTTIPSLRTETLNRIELQIPELSIQHKILKYLATIDDKIELNTAINENLPFRLVIICYIFTFDTSISPFISFGSKVSRRAERRVFSVLLIIIKSIKGFIFSLIVW